MSTILVTLLSLCAVLACAFVVLYVFLLYTLKQLEKDGLQN